MVNWHVRSETEPNLAPWENVAAIVVETFDVFASRPTCLFLRLTNEILGLTVARKMPFQLCIAESLDGLLTSSFSCGCNTFVVPPLGGKGVEIALLPPKGGNTNTKSTKVLTTSATKICKYSVKLPRTDCRSRFLIKQISRRATFVAASCCSAGASPNGSSRGLETCFRLEN